MTGNKQYLLVAKAIAASGLSQTSFAVGISSIQVIIDTAAPKVVISRPANGVFVSARQHRRKRIAFAIERNGDPILFVELRRERLLRSALSYLSGGASYYWDTVEFSSFTVNANTAWLQRPSAAGTWTYPFDINWPSDASHAMKLEVRGEDNALSEAGAGPGNIGTPSIVGTDVMNFNVDFVAPAGTITWPSPLAPVSSTTIQMTGSDTDDLSGVKPFKSKSRRARRRSLITRGSGWTPGRKPGSPPTTTPNTWTYTIPSAALVSGNLYYLRLQLTDVAGNLFTTHVTTFTYDTQAPAVTISTPVAGNFYSLVQLSTPFAGTASDNGSNPTGVSTVTISITDVDGTGANWFNGSTYTAGGPFFLPAQGTPTNWTFNNVSLFFKNDHRYDVTAKAVDNAGNSNTTTNRFVYDVIPPTSTIAVPAIPYFTSLPTISGSVTDNPGGITYNNPAGVSTSGVQMAVRKVGSNWWNSGSNQFNGSDPDYSYFTVTNTTTTLPNPWTVSVPAGFRNSLVTGNSYRFVSRSVDQAGNAEFGVLNANIPAAVGLTVLYDSATVISSISFPVNGGFYQGINSLSGTADDTLAGSGVNQVSVAIINGAFSYWNGSTFTGDCSTSCSPWQTAVFVGNSSGTWTYNTPGVFSTNQQFHVFVRGIDRAGNIPADPNFISGGISFDVDATTPTSTITSPSSGTILTTGITSVAGTAFDTSSNGSGVTNVKYRISRQSDGNYFDHLTNNFDITPAGGDIPTCSTTLVPGVLPSYTWSSQAALSRRHTSATTGIMWNHAPQTTPATSKQITARSRSSWTQRRRRPRSRSRPTTTPIR